MIDLKSNILQTFTREHLALAEKVAVDLEWEATRMEQEMCNLQCRLNNQEPVARELAEARLQSRTARDVASHAYDLAVRMALVVGWLERGECDGSCG